MMTPLEKLTHIRQFLKEHHLDGFILPHDDEFLSEFTPAHFERLAWLTNFTGSAGVAVILPKKAALFSDGRYTIQMPQQVDETLWKCLNLQKTSPSTWIKQHIDPSAKIAYDPRIMSKATLAPFQEVLGKHLIALNENPVDIFWKDRPPLSNEKAFIHKIEFSGEDSANKRQKIAHILKKQKCDALVLSNSDSIAWLLNLRGRDIQCTPICLAFAILNKDGHVHLFTTSGKIPPDVAQQLTDDVHLHTFDEFVSYAAQLKGKKVSIDRRRNAIWFEQIFAKIGASVTHNLDPCVGPKSIKNPTEQTGMRNAHIYDGIALCRFLHWFSEHAQHTSEIQAADQLHQLRAQHPLFVEESFPTISATGPNSAITHYSATHETNQKIQKNQVYLVDSGGQYYCGTTDCTRTMWTGGDAPPLELKAAFTYVLKGHLRLSLAIFPPRTPGSSLDALARYDLWQHGMDYDHGTGHGVGCFLSVHEGPVSISRRASFGTLTPGMVLSNEPGYYKAGHWGIRSENLLLVKEATKASHSRPFLCFEPLTLVPFDQRLIDINLLTRHECDQLNHYHQHVYEMIAPHLDTPQKEWLMHACRQLS